METICKFWDTLLLSQRRMVVRMLFLILIGMTLEMLGVGLVVPALAIVIQDDASLRYVAVISLRSALGISSQRQFIAVAMLVLVGTYVIKGLFLGFLAWQQARFSFGMQSTLSKRLFSGYLRQPYTFHLQRNSAHLISNITTESNQFAACAMSVMTLVAEALNVVGIGALLIFIEPLGSALLITVLGLAGWGTHRMTRNYLFTSGKARQFHDAMRVQHLQQGLGGVKEIKLLGRMAEFLARYAVHADEGARIQARMNFLQQVPRLWLELLVVIGLAAVIFLMMGQGKSPKDLVPTLGLFAAAAFRLLPSVTRILGSMQTVRALSPVVATLHQELRSVADLPPPRCDQPIRFQRSIDLDGVQYRYPGADVASVNGVSVKIPRGAAVGFIGGSGAGKSTVVDLILGLLTPTSGAVRIDGVDIQSNLRGWQDQIGYVPQLIFLTDDSLRRNVALGVPDGEISELAVRAAIRAAQLDELVNSLPQGLDSVVGERGVRLSGGQRQRIGIARALYHDPPVLVLDEATSALDMTTESGVMAAVRALQDKKTVIIIAHRLSTVAYCARIYRLEAGQVAEIIDNAQDPERLAQTAPSPGLFMST